MADWEVVKGTAIILAGQTAVDVFPPLPVMADPATDCFPIITSTRYSGMGVTSGGGNQDLNRVTVHINNASLNIALGPPEIHLRRFSSAAVDCRVEWEVWCWIGPPAGLNRWRVLLQDHIAQPTGDTTADSASFTPNDPTRVAVLLTGQSLNTTINSAANQGQYTTELVSLGGGSYLARVRRGVSSPGITSNVSVAVVELGAYWRPVQRLTFRSDDPDRPDLAPGTEQRAWAAGSEGEYGILDITRPTLPRSGLAAGLAPLLDITRTLIQVQYRNTSGGAQGNDDNGENAELGSVAADVALAAAAGHHNNGAGHAPPATALNSLITRRSTGTSDTTKFTTVWFLEYDPPGGTVHLIDMQAQHLHRYFATIAAGEEEVDDISDPTPHPWLPTPVNLDLASAGIAFGLAASSSGTLVGPPRGWTNMRLTAGAPIDIRMTRSESNQNERQSATAAQMPSVLVVQQAGPGSRLAGVVGGAEALEGLTGGLRRGSGF
jgi:hypothetical protein